MRYRIYKWQINEPMETFYRFPIGVTLAKNGKVVGFFRSVHHVIYIPNVRLYCFGYFTKVYEASDFDEIRTQHNFRNSYVYFRKIIQELENAGVNYGNLAIRKVQRVLRNYDIPHIPKNGWSYGEYLAEHYTLKFKWKEEVVLDREDENFMRLKLYTEKR